MENKNYHRMLIPPKPFKSEDIKPFKSEDFHTYDASVSELILIIACVKNDPLHIRKICQNPMEVSQFYGKLIEFFSSALRQQIKEEICSDKNIKK